MSTANEHSLKELNETSQQFRADMEERLFSARQCEEELFNELEELKVEKETQEVVSTCTCMCSEILLICITVTIGANLLLLMLLYCSA